MIDPITDTNDIPIEHLSMVLDESSDSSVFQVKIKCQAQLFLVTEDDVDARVLVRLAGTADAFVDIADNPIDLTTFAGLTKTFDIKVHTNAVTGLVRTALPVRLTLNL